MADSTVDTTAKRMVVDLGNNTYCSSDSTAEDQTLTVNNKSIPTVSALN
jgi:hypothetical protein